MLMRYLPPKEKSRIAITRRPKELGYSLFLGMTSPGILIAESPVLSFEIFPVQEMDTHVVIFMFPELKNIPQRVVDQLSRPAEELLPVKESFPSDSACILVFNDACSNSTQANPRNPAIASMVRNVTRMENDLEKDFGILNQTRIFLLDTRKENETRVQEQNRFGLFKRLERGDKIDYSLIFRAKGMDESTQTVSRAIAVLLNAMSLAEGLEPAFFCCKNYKGFTYRDDQDEVLFHIFMNTGASGYQIPVRSDLSSFNGQDVFCVDGISVISAFKSMHLNANSDLSSTLPYSPLFLARSPSPSDSVVFSVLDPVPAQQEAKTNFNLFPIRRVF